MFSGKPIPTKPPVAIVAPSRMWLTASRAETIFWRRGAFGLALMGKS